MKSYFQGRNPGKKGRESYIPEFTYRFGVSPWSRYNLAANNKHQRKLENYVILVCSHAITRARRLGRANVFKRTDLLFPNIIVIEIDGETHLSLLSLWVSLALQIYVPVHVICICFSSRRGIIKIISMCSVEFFAWWRSRMSSMDIDSMLQWDTVVYAVLWRC